ncbi:hypothetical protein H2200_003671 [Cladophialophora chaetospira]|uniref:Uncharacterized protein n=1 Tax=Cladophialophora chaetospira TaxID=386627 RepID=A0AA38XFC0_9EURO|nr:hypothetical protein H2200_003671 [Cladophialophora chaetospira]
MTSSIDQKMVALEAAIEHTILKTEEAFDASTRIQQVSNLVAEKIGAEANQAMIQMVCDSIAKAHVDYKPLLEGIHSAQAEIRTAQTDVLRAHRASHPPPTPDFSMMPPPRGTTSMLPRPVGTRSSGVVVPLSTDSTAPATDVCSEPQHTPSPRAGSAAATT